MHLHPRLAAQQPKAANDWIIVPGVRVGPVLANASEVDLRRIFGAANVEPQNIEIGEGE